MRLHCVVVDPLASEHLLRLGLFFRQITEQVALAQSAQNGKPSAAQIVSCDPRRQQGEFTVLRN
jgi:hypothetical protein